jgi:hypothetical protein
MEEVARAEETHLHVVWQKGNELRRATIYRPEPNPYERLYQSEHGKRWLKVALLAGWRPEKRPSYLGSSDQVLNIRREEGKPGLIPVSLSPAGVALLDSEQYLTSGGDRAAPDMARRYARSKETALNDLARDGYDYCSGDGSWAACMETLWAHASRFADDIDHWQRRFCERWAALSKVRSTVIVSTMSAMIRTSRPSRIARPTPCRARW